MNSSDADLTDYDAIFSKNFDDRDNEILRWRYQRSPLKNSVILLAEDFSMSPPDKAALYAIHNTPFRVDGHQVEAAQSLDTLTDSQHRRQGLFVWLAQATYEQFLAADGKLVFGFPNPNSHKTFATRLNWSMLNPMPFIIRPMRTGYFFAAAGERLGLNRSALSWLDIPLWFTKESNPTGLKLQRMEQFGEDHDRIWEAFSANVSVCVDRSASFMNWRIFDYPQPKYKAIGAFRDGQLLAEVVWCLERKHGGRVGYIMELLHYPDDVAAGVAVLKYALSDMANQGCDAVLAWNVETSPNAATYAKLGFLPLPERLRPTNLYWGVRSFDSSIDAAVNDRANWYISYTDSDTT